MKKLLIVTLSIFMVLSLAACGGGDSSSSDAGNETEASESPKFEEIVLFDTDEATMKVVDYDPDSDWGFALKVYLENKTDKTLMFAAEEASVNGFMMDPFWATEVAGGKKENTEINWYTEELEKNGIESVEDIEMKIRVYDSDNWDEVNIIEDSYSIKIPQ